MDASLRRRVYIAGLLIGTPTVPVIWWLRGPDDPLLWFTYPFLTALLIGMLGGLWSRRLAVATAERVTIVTVGAFYLLRLTVATHATADLATVTAELSESTFWGINLVFVFSYLAFDTRRALRVCIALYAACLGVVATRLVPDVLAGVHTAEAVTYLRACAFLGVSIALLYGLAHVKEQLAETRLTAATMTDLAHTDPLTGVANRRRLDDTLKTRVAEAERYGRPVSVLLIDLDDFKAINDVSGHVSGDAVLRELADVLRPVLRTSDLLGRWGGEEFLVIAPETAASEAERLAERCCRHIAAQDFPAVDRRVTASIGVAEWRPGETVRDLLRRADSALYAAKRAGRNQVQAA